MGEEFDKTRQEFTARVLYSLLRPAVGLADRFRMPMKDFTGLLQRAYYQAKRARGLTLPQVAAELQMSTRTADRLARSMRENFFVPEQEHELPRKVEFMLWSGPRGLARLQQLLPEYEPHEVERSLMGLVKEGRVKEVEGRTLMYAATRRANRLPDDTMAARVDGLNNLMETLLETVRRRFFEQDQRAGARTVGLRVRRSDIAQIEKLYEEVVWERLLALDNQARDADPEDVIEMGLVMCWSPLEQDDVGGGEG